MKLVLIPAGKFMMGTPDFRGGPQAYGNLGGNEEKHEVAITKPFYLGVYTVTQAEYEKVMVKNPSGFCAQGKSKDEVAGMDTRHFPVEQVSWNDSQEFCRKLSEMPEEKQAGRVYRLPTEAEWEYACRAGTTTVYHVGNALSTDQANFGRVLGRTTTVGSYQPNAFGLYDMHGNVWQWCQDWYDANYYQNSPKEDPPGPAHARDRVIRGGTWHLEAGRCRSAFRIGYAPGSRLNTIGFRLVAVQSER